MGHVVISACVMQLHVCIPMCTLLMPLQVTINTIDNDDDTIASQYLQLGLCDSKLASWCVTRAMKLQELSEVRRQLSRTTNEMYETVATALLEKVRNFIYRCFALLGRRR